MIFAAAAFAEPVEIPAGGGLAAFRIDRTEVSLDAFEAFAAAWSDRRWWTEAGWAWLAAHPGGAGREARAAKRAGRHPVVMVSAYEAEAYCAAQGGRLPTEAEWARAACGEDGRRFPWGEDEDYEARWYGEGKGGAVTSVKTAPVDEAPARLASPYGLLHAAGNVWEWTADAWGRWRAIRGGSFMNLPSYCSCAHREPARPEEGRLTLGFRCAY